MKIPRARTIRWAEADLVAQTLELMNQRGVGRAELARRLGVVPAYVTRLLSGTANLTIATMAKIADALNASIEIKLNAHPSPAKQSNRRPTVRKPPKRKHA